MSSACQQINRTGGQGTEGERVSPNWRTGILQVVDNQVCVFLDPVLRWPISGVGARSAASSGCLRALFVRQFGETVGTAAEGETVGTASRRRNCRHCRRRRSRRREALPLMSRSLRPFDFRLLNRNAPDVPWVKCTPFVGRVNN